MSCLIRPLVLTACLAFSLAAPAAAMGERPARLPEFQTGGPITDMEAAAGHVLVVGPRITFATSKGSFSVVTFPKEAPKAVAQVLRLARSGFYDGLQFHRVVPGFVVQAGDPASRTLPVGDPTLGRGGSGSLLPPEYEDQHLKHLAGTAGMARGQEPGSADSQFYVTLAPKPHLDGNYTIWGQVVAGGEVLAKLEPGDRIEKASVEAP